MPVYYCCFRSPLQD